MQAANGKPVSLYCPMNFAPEEILSADERAFGDGIVYLFHAIMMCRVQDPRYRKGYCDGFVGLKAQYLQNIAGRRDWPQVRRLALSNGLVECNGSYSTESRAKGYRVRSPYAEAKWELREVTDERLMWRLLKWRSKRRRDEWGNIMSCQIAVAPDVCRFLWEKMQRCQIREDAPVDDFAPEVSVAVDKIRRGDWFFHVDRYGRIHTNIANLKREMRPYLLVDDQSLVNVDIANSQPLFVGILSAGRRGRQGGTGQQQGGSHQGGNLYVRHLPPAGVGFAAAAPDLRRYLELCEEGRLYRYVAERLAKRLDYDTLKRRVLATIYDKDSHRNAVYRVLDQQFPTLMSFTREVKRGDYRRLAQLAQRAESRFMYGQVVPRLMRERPGLFVATIHDSVLVPRGEEEYVRDVMASEFRRLGVNPTLRIQT